MTNSVAIERDEHKRDAGRYRRLAQNIAVALACAVFTIVVMGIYIAAPGGCAW